VKLDILVNGDPVDALSIIVHRDMAYDRGRALAAKMRELIPRQMFEIAIQAAIGGRIIECHLRMAEQWLDLNGPGWLEAVVRLYNRGEWSFDWRPREGYSVVLFGPHGRRWRVDRSAVAAFLERPGISSIQITFEDDKPADHHAMPPGGFRLAIVNCWDLEAGRAVRRALRRMFRAA